MTLKLTPQKATFRLRENKAGKGKGKDKKPAAPATPLTVVAYREGGEEIYYGFGQCALGAVLVAESKKGICRVAIGNNANQLVVALHAAFPRANLLEGDDKFGQLVKKIADYLAAPRKRHYFTLDLQGTAFQRQVWETVLTIPPGATMTYAEIAALLGSPKAMRAVGNACCANPLAGLVPCHRVVRSSVGKKAAAQSGLRAALLALEHGKPTTINRQDV